MTDCLFCKIIAGDIPSKCAYEDDRLFAFHDIDPKAPTHLLLLPKKHIDSLNAIKKEDSALVGHLVEAAATLAKELGHDKNGYRLVMNCNKDAGQTVFHLHCHLLAGRSLGWPPG